MAQNFVFDEAQAISLPVPTGTLAGSPVRVGVLNAVTVTDEGSVTKTISLGAGASIVQPSGALSGNAAGFASARTNGSANLTVVGALTVGQAVFIKVSDNTLTATAAAGTKEFGAALTAKGSGTGLAHVKILNGGIVADAA